MGSFPLGKSTAKAWRLPSLHLVLISRMSRSHISYPPKRLHVVAGQFYFNFTEIVKMSCLDATSCILDVSFIFLSFPIWNIGPLSVFLWSHIQLYTRQDSPGRVISPSQRPLPTQDNTTYKHKRQTSRPRAGLESVTLPNPQFRKAHLTTLNLMILK
jgi:hypothetical protein